MELTFGLIHPTGFYQEKGTFSGPRKSLNSSFIDEGIFLKKTAP
jgi:hypothetical protein